MNSTNSVSGAIGRSLAAGSDGPDLSCGAGLSKYAKAEPKTIAAPTSNPAHIPSERPVFSLATRCAEALLVVPPWATAASYLANIRPHEGQVPASAESVG